MPCESRLVGAGRASRCGRTEASFASDHSSVRVESFVRDLRFARRNLMRTPVLALVAVLSIALGIAATTAVFSVVDAALFRPPPLNAADRLAILLETEDE